MIDPIEDDALLGDLEELYALRKNAHGSMKAGGWLVMQLLRSCFFLLAHTLSWRVFMFFNYLKIAVRNLRRQWGVSAINVVGLGLGMALSLMVVLYLHFETHYDSFHSKSNRICRLLLKEHAYMGKQVTAFTPLPLMSALIDNIPEVMDATYVRCAQDVTVKQGDLTFRDSHLLFAEPSFFQIFDFPLVSGDVQSAFMAPFTVAISQRMARKYWPQRNPLGQEITINGDVYQVTAVFKDVSTNSYFQFDWATSVTTFLKKRRIVNKRRAWFLQFGQTYLLLNEGVHFDSLASKLQTTYAGIVPKDDNQDILNGLQLQPLQDIHFETRTAFEFEQSVDKRQLWLYGVVALAILLVACFNYINLSTARATIRAKEVGLRKVVGAVKHQLMHQFMAEAGLILLLSLVLAVSLFSMLIGPFSQYVGQDLSRYLICNPQVLTLLLLIYFITGCLAGIYPALNLSRLRPAQLFREQAVSGHRRTACFRNLLVVFQFVVTVFFLVGMLATHRQFHFMVDKDTGYRKEDILTIENQQGLSMESIQTDFLQIPGVLDVTRADQPISDIVNGGYVSWLSQTQDSVLFHILRASPNYLSFYEIPLLKGRAFRLGEPEAEKRYIVNETALRHIGLDVKDECPIGLGPDGEIIGVVADFHFQSLHQEVAPLLIRALNKTWDSRWGYVEVKIDSQRRLEVLNQLEAAWKHLGGSLPFSYHFVDQRWLSLYQNENRFNQSFIIFSVLAVFIACMGMAGLTLFAMQRRRKEIGIRKVLGASVLKIFILVCRDFLIRIGLAVIIAWPLAYWVLSRWLEQYPYRISLSADIFIVSGVLTAFIALATVTAQTLKAARMQPVTTLRLE